MTDSLVLDALPVRLQLASLEKSSLPRVMHALLGLLFFDHQDPQPQVQQLSLQQPERLQAFFSFTETPREVSLVLETTWMPRLVAALSQQSITVCPTIWRCLEVSVGEYGGALGKWIAGRLEK